MRTFLPIDVTEQCITVVPRVSLWLVSGINAPPFFRERALALSPRSTFKPLGGVEVERVFRRGDTPPIFKGPAVLRRCCPPSAEGVACCRSPHQPRGAAAVLPFFSARAEEAARCQCLRGWAQAVGHVTPSLDGGPPCFFHGGCGRRVSHCAEEGRGPGTHPIFRLRAERLPTLLHRSILGERMLLPLATIQPRTARTPRSFLKYTRNGFSLRDRQANDRNGNY